MLSKCANTECTWMMEEKLSVKFGCSVGFDIHLHQQNHSTVKLSSF